MTRPFDLPTTPIDALVERTSLADALSAWKSFVSFRPAEMSRPASPAMLVNGKGQDGWYAVNHQMAGEVRELGVYFLRDVIVSGHFYTFHDDRYLHDGSGPSNVAMRFIKQEQRDHHSLVHRDRSLTLDRPALVIGGPGYPIWGHWLLDFLPRLAIAAAMLGPQLRDFVIPMPSDAPKWLPAFLQFFAGVEAAQIVSYDRGTESVICPMACIPTFAHSNYFLHSFMREYYQSFWRSGPIVTPARFCVSRKAFGQTRHSVVRTFEEEDYFEDMAVRHGFEIVYPETLDFRGQIDLFANAAAIVGQYGSGMHSSLFSRPGTLVGQFCMPNSIQSRIAGLCEQRMAYLFPDLDTVDAQGTKVLSVSRDAIDEFFRKFIAAEK